MKKSQKRLRFQHYFITMTARPGLEVVYGSGVPSTPAVSPLESTTKYEKSGKGLIPLLLLSPWLIIVLHKAHGLEH